MGCFAHGLLAIRLGLELQPELCVRVAQGTGPMRGGAPASRSLSTGARTAGLIPSYCADGSRSPVCSPVVWTVNATSVTPSPCARGHCEGTVGNMQHNAPLTGEATHPAGTYLHTPGARNSLVHLGTRVTAVIRAGRKALPEDGPRALHVHARVHVLLGEAQSSTHGRETGLAVGLRTRQRPPWPISVPNGAHITRINTRKHAQGQPLVGCLTCHRYAPLAAGSTRWPPPLDDAQHGAWSPDVPLGAHTHRPPRTRTEPVRRECRLACCARPVRYAEDAPASHSRLRGMM